MTKSGKYILVAVVWSCIAITACRNDPTLRVLSHDEQYELAIDNKLIYDGIEIYTSSGVKISRDSLSAIARSHGREYCADYYVDKDKIITKMVIRKSTASDSILYERINQKLETSHFSEKWLV